VDKRTDIWAFGCCLYETLTGRKAFKGETVTDTLAAIIHKEPDWEALAPTSETVQKLLRRCLTKAPQQRLRDIGDARIEIGEAIDQHESGPSSDAVSKPTRLPAVGAVLASSILFALVGFWIGTWRPVSTALPSASPGPVSHTVIDLP
jgi:serine/threonine-protein kinase